MDNRLQNYFGSDDHLDPSADRSDVRGGIRVTHLGDDTDVNIGSSKRNRDDTLSAQPATEIANRWIFEHLEGEKQEKAFRIIENFTAEELEDIAAIFAEGSEEQSIITEQEAKSEKLKWTE